MCMAGAAQLAGSAHDAPTDCADQPEQAITHIDELEAEAFARQQTSSGRHAAATTTAAEVVEDQAPVVGRRVRSVPFMKHC